MTSIIASIPDAPAEDRLAYAITAIARETPDRIAVVSAAGSASRRSTSYATLAATVADLERRLDAARPVGVVARARQAESLIAITAACGRQHVPVAFVADDSLELAFQINVLMGYY